MRVGGKEEWDYVRGGEDNMGDSGCRTGGDRFGGDGDHEGTTGGVEVG